MRGGEDTARLNDALGFSGLGTERMVVATASIDIDSQGSKPRWYYQFLLEAVHAVSFGKQGPTPAHLSTTLAARGKNNHYNRPAALRTARGSKSQNQDSIPPTSRTLHAPPLRPNASIAKRMHDLRIIKKRKYSDTKKRRWKNDGGVKPVSGLCKANGAPRGRISITQ